MSFQQEEEGGEMSGHQRAAGDVGDVTTHLREALGSPSLPHSPESDHQVLSTSRVGDTSAFPEPKRHIPNQVTECQGSGVKNTDSSWHISTLGLTRTKLQSELNHCLSPRLINVSLKYLMSRECGGEGQRYSSFFALPSQFV